MVLHYLKIAWRSLTRNKVFSIINILGLALGLCCSLIIFLWIQDEQKVDGFHTNGKQLYQIYERSFSDGKVEASYSTQGMLAQEIKRVIPEVKYACSTDFVAAPGASSTFEFGRKVNKMNGFYAGEDFLKMFSYPLIRGNVETALNNADGIAISRKMADFFFGTVDLAVGKILRFENKQPLLVTAVFENIPASSSQQFDFLLSWNVYLRDNEWLKNWGNASPRTYFMLRAGAGKETTESKLKDFIYHYKSKDPGVVVELGMQPYPDIYLHSAFKNGFPGGGRIEYVHLFNFIAIFILLIACINFMNLATAASVKRAKEVGVRKVVGARRWSLIAQFIGEAILFALLSVFIAIFLTELILPVFNQLTEKQLSLPFNHPGFWLGIGAITIVTGIVSGIYPAIYLSSLNPVSVIKGGLKFSWKSNYFRQGLVIFQFSLSIMLIAGTLVIYKQMRYVQTKNIGYDRDNLMYLPIEGELISKYNLFKDEAQKLPGVISISKMRNSPTFIEHHSNGISWPGEDPNLNVSFADAVVGYDFVSTMKLEMSEGRDFSRDFRTDSTGYLLNETAVKKIGFADPIGKTVTWANHPGKIIGVIKDFHFGTMYRSIEPLIVRLDDNWSWGTILIRTKNGQTKEVIAGLQDLCQRLNPGFPFSYQFSDQEFSNLYKTETIISQITDYFAVLAIFISCLGLFGLASFTVVQRNKEIAVRKVLGSSVPGIISLLTRNFLRPVFISICIAIPLAIYFANQWLHGFAYQTTLAWWIFGLAGLSAIIIALITVSFQSIQAAFVNPVKSLRSE